MILFCPMIVVALYLFRDSLYQILTLITPFAFVEFLHIKYEKVFLVNEYYMIFLILALLCVLYRAQTVRNNGALKIIIGILTVVQLITGYIFLNNSAIGEERNFATTFYHRQFDPRQQENRGLADFLNQLPKDSHILVDDATAYPIVAYTTDIKKLTLPYQGQFLSAIEAPAKYDAYILLATEQNEVTGFTQLNNKYVPVIEHANSGLKLKRIYETNDWILYKIL